MIWYIGVQKGPTAYSWQVFRLYCRITYLRGDYWKWRPWRRVSFGWDRSDLNDQ